MFSTPPAAVCTYGKERVHADDLLPATAFFNGKSCHATHYDEACAQRCSRARFRSPHDLGKILVVAV